MKKIALFFLFIMSHTTSPFSGHNLHQFMWANIDSFSNNPERALQRYQHITQQSLWTYHGYIPFLFDYHKYETIVSLANKIDAHFAHHPHLQLLLALSFKKIDNHAEGNKRIIALAAKHPTQANIILRAAQLHVEQKEPHKALTMIDTYLNKSPHKGNSFLFYFLKGHIYTQLNDTTRALENIEKCIQLQPSYSQAWLMRAILEEQRGNINHAIEGYSQCIGLADETQKQAISKRLAKLMVQQPMIRTLPSILNGYESALETSIRFFTKHLYPQALAECNKYLHQNPDSIKAKLLKVQIFTAQNNVPDAITLLCKEIDHNPDNDIWYKTLYYLRHKTDGKGSIETVFRTLAEKYPKSLSAQLYTADIVLRTTRHSDALTYLLKAESLAATNTQKAALLYQQALLYYDGKDLINAASALHKTVALNQKHAPAYNLLAYIAAKQKQFSHAHEAIEKTLAIAPENYHYLDTKGYILYKEKKYTDAHTIFASIAQRCNNDARVLNHLKKTYNKRQEIEKTTLHAHNRTHQ